MKIFSIIGLIGLMNSLAISQSFFSVIPDLDGDEMEGKIFNVIPLENEIKILGVLHDSLVPGFDAGTWPVLGSMSYTGELLSSKILVDSNYSDGFFYHSRRLAFKNDSICYVYDRRDLGGQFLDAYLIELNIRNGRILRSKIIYDQISNHQVFLATDLTIGKNGDIFLVNVTDEPGPHSQILTVLDSNLIVQTQVLIPDFGRSNITKYIEEDVEGNLVLIGLSLGEQNSIWFESMLFRQVLNKDYTTIDFKLAPTTLDQTIAGYDYYPVIKAKTGDWVFATQVATSTNDCPGCAIWVPYVVIVASDFSEVQSETRLFDGNINSSNSEYYVKSITEVSDGYIFAGSTDGMFGIETSGLLGKVNMNGDSVWLKHYIPVEWDTTQGRFFHLQDIKTTPAGNIVIGGLGSDRFNSKILPWLLHLDKDGCLEPGCNITSNIYVSGNQELGFHIYPNPAHRECNIQLLTNQSGFQNYRLTIVNNLGVIIQDFRLNFNAINLTLNIEALAPGNYFIQLWDSKNHQVGKKILVVN